MTAQTTPPTALPPDPEAYDSVRAQHARARGLAAPYIAGGRDPEPEAGIREERLYGRLLVAMVVAVVLGGFVIGFAIAWLQAGS
jgi:predicted cobalt transporter CbtA